MEALLAVGADVDAAPQSGRTPLIGAVIAGRTDIVRLLLQNGAAVDMKHHWDGKTALSLAAGGITTEAGKREPRVDVLQVLLDYDADVNSRDHDGSTPLMEAVKAGHAQSVRLLLAGGADPRATDNRGLSPLDWAAGGNIPTIQLLLRQAITRN